MEGMEGKDPYEVIEQLKTGVKNALENTDQIKLFLIEGIINVEEDGDAEMAGLRVAAIEADPASFLQSKKRTERRFAECVRGLQHLRTKLNVACKEQDALQKHKNVPLAQVALSKLSETVNAGFAAIEAKVEGLSERVDAQSGRIDTLVGEVAARQLTDGEKIRTLEGSVRNVIKTGRARQLAPDERSKH